MSAFDRLIDQLKTLPGVGQRSAERIAFDLLKRPADDVLQLADALKRFKTDLKACSICGHVTESDPCPICTDPKRDRTRILVVEQPTDVVSLEQTGAYRGLYHVLMGRLSPMDGVGQGELTIDLLMRRVRSTQAQAGHPSPSGQADEKISEVILATNPNLEGDGTALVLQEALSEAGVTVTRIARGVPTGSTLQTVSKAVLSDALQARHGM